MTNNRCFHYRIIIMVVINSSLTACRLEFPIAPYEWIAFPHEPIRLSDSTRIVLSSLWYALLLAMFITLPLYVKNVFEVTVFMKIINCFGTVPQ